jgi:pimeloyl-ACP methyl ester carboxylesterase
VLHPIAGAGHIIPEETPDEVNAALLRMLHTVAPQ